MAQHDVAVIGAGIAGLAACIFLRQQGLTVVCLDTHPYPHRKVGESLDWSRPGLLERLGINASSLLEDPALTGRALTSRDVLRDAAAAGRPAFFLDKPRVPELVWDIPSSSTETGVGFVLPADTVRERRQADDSVETILRQELARHPRFQALLDAAPTLHVESTSFSRTSRTTS